MAIPTICRARHQSPDVLFNAQELALLAAIETPHPNESIALAEMRCQHDMTIRARRLYDYHRRVGDLDQFLPLALVA